MNVLMLTTSDNEHSDSVQRAISRKLGNSLLRLNFDQTELFPTLNLELDSPRLGEFNLMDFDSVFVHHPKIKIPADMGTDDIDRKLRVSQWQQALVSIGSSLKPGVIWANKPRTQQENSVIHQLRFAKSLGFAVPQMCITSSHETLGKFYEAFGKIILKPGNLPGLSIEGLRLLTKVITPADIDPAGLSSSPCIFQQYVEKAYELRIHVIGDKVLTCKIDSQKCDDTKLDWRRYNLPQTPHSTYQLGDLFSRKCVELTKGLGLSVGIIDVIVTPSGENVFLECNSQGSWLWIERLTSLPITEEIVSLLLRAPV